MIGVFVGVTVDTDADGAQGAHDVGAAGRRGSRRGSCRTIAGDEAAAAGVAEGVALVGLAGAAAGTSSACAASGWTP